jgi:hypothetical protein
MNIVLTLLPVALVVAQYVLTPRQPECDSPYETC